MASVATRFTARSEDDALEQLHQRKLTDGLPVVVPTAERVEMMLLHSGGLDADGVIGEVGPSGGQLTVEKAAINAVMAGCKPELFPVVIAAASAITDPVFDLTLLTATTHCVTPFIIVNGPARKWFDIASGVGAMGPGFRANATIGRAIRLICMNVGGGWPGVGDMATLGSPTKFTCCLAEAEEESPFDPLHVSLGFGAEDSTVTVIGVEGPHQLRISAGSVEESDTILRVAGAALANPASSNIFFSTGQVVVILNPAHARLLRQAGHTRQSIQERLFETATQTRGYLRSISPLANSALAQEGDDDEILRVVKQPTDFLVMVAGGPFTYSCAMPTFGGGAIGQIAISRKLYFDKGCEAPPSLRER